MADMVVGGAWGLDDEDRLPTDIGAGGGLTALAAPERSPFLGEAQKLAQSGLDLLGPTQGREAMEAERGALGQQAAALAPRDKTVWDSPLLRFGLEMMQAAAKPGATFLGSAGAGGTKALDFWEAQKARDTERALKYQQLNRELAQLPLKYGSEQLGLASKLGAVKAPSPWLPLPRYGLFNPSTNQRVAPDPNTPGLAGNKRIFGSKESGYHLWNPADNSVTRLIDAVDPASDPRVLARFREQFGNMAKQYEWASIEDMANWVEAKTAAAMRGTNLGMPSPEQLGAKRRAEGTPVEEPAPVSSTPTLPTPAAGPVAKAGRTAEAEADAKEAVKEYQALSEQADQAGTTRSSIAQIRSIDLDTGRLAPFKESLGGWFEAFGMKDRFPGLVKHAALTQEFNRELMDAVLSKQMLQKGVQTEGDAKRIKDTLANVTNVREANDFILRVMDSQAATLQLKRQWVAQAREGGMSARQALSSWNKIYDRGGAFLMKEVSGKPVFLNEFLSRVRARPEYKDMPEDEFTSKALETWRGL